MTCQHTSRQNLSAGADRNWWADTAHTACAVLNPRPDEPSDEVRWDLVDRVRKEIAAGTYDTEDKWEAALDRLLDHVEGGVE